MSKPDLSTLRPPIQLGSSGVQYLMECIETGTEEVKSAIFEECDVLLECKVCKSIFRALPNFLAHKRFYCVEAYQDTRVAFLQQQPEEYTVIVEPKSPPNEDSQSEEDVYVVEHPGEAKPASTEFYDKTIDRIKTKSSAKKEHEIELTKLPGNPNAVKQQVKRPREEKRKEEPAEKKKAPVSQPPPPKKSKMDLRANPKPKVKPDKMMVVTYKERLTRLPGCNIKNLKCQICKTILSSHKSLYNHMMTQHSSVRTYYPCPYCKHPFTKLYSLTVHLERTHKKSKTQIEKMRSRLRKSAFKKSVKDASRVVIDTKSAQKVPEDKKMSPVVSLTPCVGTHKCEQCGRSFVKKDSLKRHLPFCLHPRKAVTEPKKEEEISEAPLANITLFSGFSNEMLKKLESLINKENNTCKKCETDFDSVDELHRHVIKHLGLKRFKCKLCKFSCPNRSGCKYHLQSNHASQVVGFSLMQFRTYIIDLNPEKPLPRKDSRSPGVKDDSSPSKRTLAFKSKKSDRSSSEEKEVKDKEVKGKEVKVTSKKPAAKKTKVAKEQQEALQVLSTRSGVKYKKPSLEEFLQSRDKKSSNGEESSEEEKETKKKAARAREETKSSKKSAGSQRRKSQSPKSRQTKETTKQSNSPKDEKKSSGKAPQGRNTSSSSKDGKEKMQKEKVLKEQKKKERMRSTPPRILRDPKASSPVVTVAPPTSSPPLTASDLLKQRRPTKPSPVKVSEQPFKTFDLSKAKVILSPLMAPASPSDLGQSLIATTSSAQKGFQRIAPKPAANDFIVLVEKPSGVNKVLDAVNHAAANDKPVSNNVMYILKDGKLTPVTQAVAGMTSVTVGGNPDVAGSCKVISVENINASKKVSEQTSDK